MSAIRVWIADLKDIHPEGTDMSMIATNQPVVSKSDHDLAMQTLRDERDRLRKALEDIRDSIGNGALNVNWIKQYAEAALTPAGGRAECVKPTKVSAAL